ncbi:MAG: cysteine dioxygenase [Candidatus Poseidoniales archaeon]|jgi:cysteine dioxygenase|tara:strand:+ start:248 stop:772 length:525 start_codon:yes stop_codon:yes gene_type:complete
MATQVVLNSEARQSLLSQCPGLTNFVGWLDSIDRRPGLDELAAKLTIIHPNVDAIRECIDYSDGGYQRHLVKQNEFYELVAICWKPGQETPIHDHIGSDCAFLIVEGISTETIYETNSDGLAYPVKSRNYMPGEVCSADEPDIHRVSNAGNLGLVELHVYTPPLGAYNVYLPVN